ncbi:uncharacterized protein RAG0_04161 [Rhynchosporium agropyri]|uniref:Uncharacterized protein n=1 Tax=Rhynchosporium agropyri TaxID=914238 RepID=A0A1E1K7R1_9HELO|nr:uncharacterized protein RAG0_04161 [Rhynchosporium agropyri]
MSEFISRDFRLEAIHHREISPGLLLELSLVAGYGGAGRAPVHVAKLSVMQFFVVAYQRCCRIHQALCWSTSSFATVVPPTPLRRSQDVVLVPVLDAVGRGWYYDL